MELKELEWRLPDESYFRNAEEPIILPNILSAPKLEKVVLEVSRFNEAELLRLNSLIQEKKILSQLHTFHFYLKMDNDNEGMECLTNTLKSACAFLPKLSELRVGRKHKFIHPLLTCPIQKDDNIFDNCIRRLLSLFEDE
ncbi:Hypothetical predicted protein [Cloeon dipterum]|uniref:Uncharacterized protein n=1 Tax=Cloeon dipterum TaxID=197152 RepID=A0A8S1D0L9_9INSE|nr:Hypothetical predicted protein [Cloeon dipterum]